MFVPPSLNLLKNVWRLAIIINPVMVKKVIVPQLGEPFSMQVLSAAIENSGHAILVLKLLRCYIAVNGRICHLPRYNYSESVGKLHA